MNDLQICYFIKMLLIHTSYLALDTLRVINNPHFICANFNSERIGYGAGYVRERSAYGIYTVIYRESEL